jgi:UPF0042 nucleotide-binding protein
MNPTAHPLEIVLVTGLSGSGKSTAVRALEDAGFFCIDNLPVPLLAKLLELVGHTDMRRVAVVVDAREGHFLSESPRVLEDLRGQGIPVRVIFLDASDEVLIRRFSETRRRHPLAPDGTVPQGITEERRLLRDLRAVADEVIDTSAVNVHELKRLLQDRFAPRGDGMNVGILSFGFRNGVPSQADLVFDVRFLPNPYFVPGMRERTGKDDDVAAYVLDSEGARGFLDRVGDLCTFLLPRYRKEGKTYLTVAIGCTGGRHRSVAIARALAERLAAQGTSVRLWDRDVEKE